MIYLLGYSSFIGMNLYKKLKKQSDMVLLHHEEVEKLAHISKNDILINVCGIYRGDSYQDYDEANHIFVQKILTFLKQTPFLIHFSSLMVYGFQNISDNELDDYQKWFITSKLNGEQY